MKPSDLQIDIERLETTLQEVQRELAEVRARSARKTLRFDVVREPEESAQQPSVPPPPPSSSAVKPRLPDAVPRHLPSDAGRYEVVNADVRRR
jgi:hypothetical protein